MSDIERLGNRPMQEVGPIANKDSLSESGMQPVDLPPLHAGSSTPIKDILNNRENIRPNAPQALLEARKFPEDPFIDIDMSPDHGILKDSNPELDEARTSTILPYIGVLGTKRL